jgi:hypothetical protein
MIRWVAFGVAALVGMIVAFNLIEGHHTTFIPDQ